MSVFRLIVALVVLLLPVAGSAQTVQESIIAQLRNQGFSQIEVNRTLLGRVVVRARSADLDRELVFNPTTGEILRDYWDEIDSDDRPAPRVLVPGDDDDGDRRRRVSGSDDSGSGSSGSGGGGSGNSGSGNSGSGSDDDDDGGNDDDDDDRDDDRGGDRDDDGGGDDDDDDDKGGDDD